MRALLSLHTNCSKIPYPESAHTEEPLIISHRFRTRVVLARKERMKTEKGKFHRAGVKHAQEALYQAFYWHLRFVEKNGVQGALAFLFFVR